MFSHWIFLITFFSLASSTHVSANNTIDGSFTRNSANSFTVHGFPSPWQFQIKQLMVIGGAGHQSPPLRNRTQLHPQKAAYVCLVTLGEQLPFSFHQVFLPLALRLQPSPCQPDFVYSFCRLCFFSLCCPNPCLTCTLIFS